MIKDRVIESIELSFPMSTEGDIIFFSVGKNGVTEIRKRGDRQHEPPVYYEIWKGGHLYADMYHFTLVRYAE